MDYACPHCHELMRIDAASGQPPPMCPRCGGNIAMDTSQAPGPIEPAPAHASRSAPAARSLATFLQSTPRKAAATVNELPRSNPEAHQPGLQQAGSHALEPTLEAAGIAGIDNKDDEVEAEPAVSTPHFDGGPAPTQRASSEEFGAGEDDQSVHVERATANELVEPTMDPASSSDDAGRATAEDAAAASLATYDISTTPSFTQHARDTTPPPRTARWQWAALALLALTLALQVLLADRARLAADAQWRPLLTSLCGALGCALPTWHEPDAFTMLSRDVRPVPGTRGALLVQATFRNDARWGQAWPVMRLSLSDADGRTVGARAFIPSEYLDAAAAQTVLAPGQSAQIMLQVREPAASVVAFSFDFD